MKNGILLVDDKIETFKNWIIEALENVDKKEKFSKLNKNRFERNENIEKYYELYNNIK